MQIKFHSMLKRLKWWSLNLSIAKKTLKAIWRLYGKILYPTESVKYLGVKIDANLNWQCQVNDLSVKLSRVNALLFKIRKYVGP